MDEKGWPWNLAGDMSTEADEFKEWNNVGARLHDRRIDQYNN